LQDVEREADGEEQVEQVGVTEETRAVGAGEKFEGEETAEVEDQSNGEPEAGCGFAPDKIVDEGDGEQREGVLPTDGDEEKVGGREQPGVLRLVREQIVHGQRDDGEEQELRGDDLHNFIASSL
jgi:hypothetical protein